MEKEEKWPFFAREEPSESKVLKKTSGALL
jgi:hypothetical protein